MYKLFRETDRRVVSLLAMTPRYSPLFLQSKKQGHPAWEVLFFEFRSQPHKFRKECHSLGMFRPTSSPGRRRALHQSAGSHHFNPRLFSVTTQLVSRDLSTPKFQPTPRLRGNDFSNSPKGAMLIKFQSTSPLRGTTGGSGHQAAVQPDFNPRPPCGGRQSGGSSPLLQ